MGNVPCETALYWMSRRRGQIQIGERRERMKVIETVYRDYRFRSRLEARWAVFFDSVGIPYEYEPEGFEMSDGTKYLPDFYLPDSDDYFEVKGYMTEYDMHKIRKFMDESHKPVTIGYSDFSFEACSYYPEPDGDVYSLEEKIDSNLIKCNACGKHYFIGECGGWHCRCCNAYDGDKYHTPVWNGSNYWAKPEPHIREALEKARQARFEHGVKP